jgi:N-acetylneuraminic acid mutarotase
MFDGALVIAGGTSWVDGVKHWLRDVQIYDVRRDGWSAGPLLPEPLAYGPSAQVDGRLEIYGGSDGVRVSRRIWTLDASLTRWRVAGEAPAALLLGRAARAGRRVFLFGGCTDVADLTGCSDIVWMREDAGEWRQVARLPGGPVALSAAAVLDGRVYLFGGCSMAAPGKLINRVEAWSFDAQNFAWRRLRDLPHAMRGHTAATAAGKVFLFGGYTADGFTAEVFSYNAGRDSYTAASPMPVAMTSIDFFFYRGAFWGAGGEDRMRSRSARTFSAVLRAGAER